MIINITSDYVETCDKKISFKTSFISRSLGKKIGKFLKQIKCIKSLPTTQGSRVFYFIDVKGNSLLLPQRIEKFDVFLDTIKKN